MVNTKDGGVLRCWGEKVELWNNLDLFLGTASWGRGRQAGKLLQEATLFSSLVIYLLAQKEGEVGLGQGKGEELPAALRYFLILLELHPTPTPVPALGHCARKGEASTKATQALVSHSSLICN